jgi:beta-glucanase (GH16 family)
VEIRTVPYLNYLGQVMAESQSGGPGVFGTSAGGETLTAPPGPSVVDGNGGGDLLIGSSGDNIFYVKDPHDVVQVAAGLSGVKTVVAFTSFTLPANVQNLTTNGTYNYAAGNALDNLIVAGNDSEMLYGGAGNDVLALGSGGAFSVVNKVGEGNDVIYGFDANDNVRLVGTSFTSFAGVQAAMTQAGADVKLQLDPSETLLFRGATVGQFTVQNFLLPLDHSLLGAQTFGDEFDTLKLYDFSKDTGQWRTNFGAGPLNADSFQLTGNGEQQVYVDPSFQGTGDHALGYNPFSISGGVLSITAKPFAAGDLGYTFGAGYASGMLDTRGIFAQKYGYFEIRAQMPTATGSWPAFWMVPDPNVGGAIEADITENLAISPSVDYVRAYSNGTGAFANALKTGDPGGFHTYGMLWTASTVTYYYDGTAVFTTPTPANWTQPMYLIVNYALGGFGQAPNAAAFPDSYKIDYVHAYALADGSTTYAYTQPPAPYGTVKAVGAPADVTGSGPPTVALNFDTDGTALSTRHVANLAAAPQQSQAAGFGKAMLFWTDSGAVYAAYSDGAGIGTPKVLMAGSTATFHETWITSGKVVVTWLQTDNGVQHAWAGILDPSTMTFTKQMLGASSGGIATVPTAKGGFEVSWHDGSQIETRAYDGFESFGPVTTLPGDIVGVDAQGHVLATYSDGAGHTLAQAYSVSVHPNAEQDLTLSPAAQAVQGEIMTLLRWSDPDFGAPAVAQVNAGQMSQAQATAMIVQEARDTTSVATLSYEFFTGKAPTAAGLDYLVSPTGPNGNNLNSAYYQAFSLENRYINFAVNLGKLGEGNAAFTAAYGNLSLFEATRTAYAKIFGEAPSDTKLHAILDPTTVLNGVTYSRSDYFAYYGQDGANGIGAKAAMVGWLLGEAEKADLGTYALSNDAFLTDVALHGAPFGVDLVGQYAQPGFIYHPG